MGEAQAREVTFGEVGHKRGFPGGSLGIPWENSALMSCTLNVWRVSLVGHIIMCYVCDVCGICVLH